jgi:type IV pilus assembly protein PilQ
MISLRAVAAAALALTGAAAPVATSSPATEATVLSLIVRPDSQRVDVVAGVRGNVEVKDFVLTNPDRIVVDLSNASLGMAKNIAYDHASRGGVVNVHYAQNRPNVVRVVVTLDAPHPYRLSRETEGVRISVMGSTSTLPAWVAGYTEAVRASSAAATPAPVIRSSPSAGPIARVVTVSPLAPKGPVNSNMMVNGRAVPVAQQQSAERRITINFEDVPILDVLKTFSEYSGHSILPSNLVKGSISASINDVPWDVALKTILNANGYDAKLNDYGILIVDTFDNINKDRSTGSTPLTTQPVAFNYTNAAQVADILKSRLSRECPTATATRESNPSFGANQSVVDPTTGVATPTVAQPQSQTLITTGNCPVRGAVTFDTLTNSVYITDVESNVVRLAEFARSLDKPQPQVNIKAKIILVDRTQLEGLGLRYDLGSQSQFFSDLVARTDSNGNPVNGNQIALGGNTISAIANAAARVPGAALQLAYSTALGAFDFTTFFEALQSTSLLDVQAEPNGTVQNNQTLIINAGTDVPIRTAEPGAGANAAGQVAQVTVNTRKTGVILQVTPRVTADNKVQMKIHIENSSVNFSGSDAVAFPTQSVDNVIMIADGNTWVIGGLTQTSVTSSRTGIPLLMELPVLGKLFGVTNRQEQKRDLLILITPHVVDPTGNGGR